MTINGNDNVMGGTSAGTLGTTQDDLTPWCDEDIRGWDVQIITNDTESQAWIERSVVAHHER